LAVAVFMKRIGGGHDRQVCVLGCLMIAFAIGGRGMQLEQDKLLRVHVREKEEAFFFDKRIVEELGSMDGIASFSFSLQKGTYFNI
jgi:hypothetical protein